MHDDAILNHQEMWCIHYCKGSSVDQMYTSHQGKEMLSSVNSCASHRHLRLDCNEPWLDMGLLHTHAHHLRFRADNLHATDALQSMVLLLTSLSRQSSQVTINTSTLNCNLYDDYRASVA